MPLMQPHRLGALALACSFMLSPSAYSEDYYWYTNHTSVLVGKKFSSPKSTCDAMTVERGKVLPGQRMENSIVYLSDSRFYCYITANGNFSDWDHVHRNGTNCGAGTLYNSGSGECESQAVSITRKQAGPPPPLACQGNPINTAIGNKFQTEVDYSGFDSLTFSHYYNSSSGLWTHTYSGRLLLGTASIVLTREDGRQILFARSGDVAVAEATELGSLVKSSTNWIYSSPTNETLIFDSVGKLTSWASLGHPTKTLTYNDSVITVTDGLGNALSFTQVGQYQPSTLSAQDLTVQYTYNGTQLTKVTRTRSGQTEQRLYHYEVSGMPSLLTGITDERGVRFATWAYDAQGRAISSEHAGGAERVLVSYNADGSSTITNELGKRATYRFQIVQGVKHVTAIEGEPSANCPYSNSTFTYDTRGQLKTQADAKGNLTTYEYNDRGLEVSRTEAAGTPQARTITTEWHPTLFLKTQVTEPGRVIRYQYDAQGRPTGQTTTAL